MTLTDPVRQYLPQRVPKDLEPMDNKATTLTLFATLVLVMATALVVSPLSAAPDRQSSERHSIEHEEFNNAPRIQSLPWQAEVAVGERLNLQVTPRDSDYTVPRLISGRLPEGSFLTDNRDGSRSLLWKPDAGQIGEHRIVFTAMDSRDPTLRSERMLIVKVVAPES